MKCFVCQAEFTGSKMLVRHLRLVHGYLPRKIFTLNVPSVAVDVCLVLIQDLENI